MLAFEKEGKTSSLKQNPGNMSDRDCQTLLRIVRKDHQNTAPKVTAELNDHLENPVSSKTVRRELHRVRFHGSVTMRKPLLLQTNITKHLE